MAGKENSFLTLEWSVENFSCWNRKIHGKKIVSPRFEAAFDLIALKLELYPRGLSGRRENVAVRVRYKSSSDFSGDFFLYGGDGSLLWAHELEAEQGEGELELSSSGPEFADLVRTVEDALEDRLTLKCRVAWDYDEVHRARTEIDAFDSAWKMSPGTFRDFGPDLKLLSTIRYPLDDSQEAGELSLLAFPPTGARFELVLEPEGCFSKVVEKVAVSTLLEVMAGRSVTRTEHREHLFVGRKRWTLSDSLTAEEVFRDDFSAVLCVRVIPSNRCKHKNGAVFAPKDVLQVDHPFRRGRLSDPEGGRTDGDLSGHLRCLYEHRDFSDFLIKCGGVSFPVHKAILSARSPVFQTMLTTDMREAASNEVVIEDLDPSTLALFLTYLYTGVVLEELDSERALKLYYAADRYQVSSLQRECAEFLSGNVSVSNVCEVLRLADACRDGGVRAAAQDFVLENYAAVVTSAEWEEFVVGEPLLAERTLESVSVRRGQS